MIRQKTSSLKSRCILWLYKKLTWNLSAIISTNRSWGSTQEYNPSSPATEAETLSLRGIAISNNMLWGGSWDDWEVLCCLFEWPPPPCLLITEVRFVEMTDCAISLVPSSLFSVLWTTYFTFLFQAFIVG